MGEKVPGSPWGGEEERAGTSASRHLFIVRAQRSMSCHRRRSVCTAKRRKGEGFFSSAQRGAVLSTRRCSEQPPLCSDD